MASKREQLRHAVHEILFTHWDPIGVNGYPGCEDEYDSYIAGVIRLLKSDADEYRMTAHLEKLETLSMGLSDPDAEKNTRGTRLLLQLMNRDKSNRST